MPLGARLRLSKAVSHFLPSPQLEAMSLNYEAVATTERGVTHTEVRGTTCGNWVVGVLNAILVIELIVVIILIPTFIIGVVTLSEMPRKIDSKMVELEQTMWCTMNNLCDGVGFGAACELRQSISQCGLGLTHGATSGITEYFSQFSSHASTGNSPSSNSPSSNSPGTSML